jgi:hypothetical protein
MPTEKKEKDKLSERDMSQLPSIREPQIVPTGHAYLVLQDHGPGQGGWGPAAALIPGVGIKGPILYTGTDQETIDQIMQMTHDIWSITNKPTKLVKYTEMEEVVSWE